MNWFPISLNLYDASCLVVGGGGVALRKTEQLLAHGARINVAAPVLHPGLTRLVQRGRIRHVGAAFTADMLTDCVLTIAATDDTAINRSVAEAARHRRLPVNVVDDPTLCSFIMPAVVTRGPVTVAVSTSGTAPVLARQIKAWLEARLPRNLGVLARVASEFRTLAKARIGSPVARRRFWERALSGTASTSVCATNSESAVRQVIATALESAATATPCGEVYLVGAGPGDPELLTLRALQLLQQADSVLYDDLVNPAVLDLARRDAEQIAVGKRCGQHRMGQPQINQLMIALASRGKRVVRLKGGDPLIFGRCGEELQALATAGIPYHIVPGITAASACAADAGIPLTHREHAHSCLFINGHGEPKHQPDYWPEYSSHGPTLAVYMGLGSAATISATLQTRGWPATTPVVLVANGTLPGREVLPTTLADLPRLMEQKQPPAPALLIIGDVARRRCESATVHHEFDWPAAPVAAAG